MLIPQPLLSNHAGIFPFYWEGSFFLPPPHLRVMRSLAEQYFPERLIPILPFLPFSPVPPLRLPTTLFRCLNFGISPLTLVTHRLCSSVSFAAFSILSRAPLVPAYVPHLYQSVKLSRFVPPQKPIDCPLFHPPPPSFPSTSVFFS